jgi:hypothetical protein
LSKLDYLSPNVGIWRSARNGLVVWLGIMLVGIMVGGLLYGPFSQLLGKLPDRLLLGLALGVVFELVFGLIFGLSGEVLRVVLSKLESRGLSKGTITWPWKNTQGRLVGGLSAFVKHLLLRLFLWRRYKFPLKAVPFLEDAADRAFLRRVGGGYSFIHRSLLDHFADLDTTP